MSQLIPSGDLSQYISDYPLPTSWTSPEVYQSQFELDQIKLNIIGLSSQNESGMEMTGSAVSPTSDSTVRAYFELIERIAILEEQSHIQKLISAERPLLNSKQKVIGSIGVQTLFPLEPTDSKWKYSKSNGVAAHVSFEKACEAAAFELIERDRLLRSWFGEFEPTPFSHPNHPIIASLQAYYEIHSFDFGENVIGIFGFPKNDHHPLLMGHASAQKKEVAFERALNEVFQRLAFLWNEEIPKKTPNFSPSPEFHLDYYLFPKSVQIIKNWLQGEYKIYNSLIHPNDHFQNTPDISFVDITPHFWKDRLYVVKAVSQERFPLTFGFGNPKALNLTLNRSGRSDTHFWIHPIA